PLPDRSPLFCGAARPDNRRPDSRLPGDMADSGLGDRLEAQQATMPHRLRRGGCVRLVSPASPPDRTLVARGAEILAEWGLRVEIGTHAFDRMGHYLAGRDEDRLEDVNEALRDPAVRAIFATRGGKCSYRIAHGLDFDAA